MPRGRKKVTDRLYIQVDEKHCITVDSYNIIVAEIYKSPGGKVLPMGKFYSNTFEYAAVCMESLNISKENINKYLAKVEGMELKRDMGKLVVTPPEGYQDDPCPFTSQSEEE